MKPFTVEHFAEYVSKIRLDSGDYWELEEFQGKAVSPILEAVEARMIGEDTGGHEFWVILPEGNAKTTLLAGLGLYLCDFTPLPWIPIGASSRDQATTLAEQAFQMIRASPGMLRRFKIYGGYRRVQPIRPDHPGAGDRGLKVHAADVGTNDGVIPFPIAICDEGHRHPDMSLYRLWRGKCRKRGASMVMISTSGEPGSEFEDMRNTIRDGLEVRERNGAHLFGKMGKTVLQEWKVVHAGDVTDMEKVKDANPLSVISVDTLTEDFASPTVDIGDWKRLKCNIPSRSTSAAVSEVEWDDALEEDLELPENAHVDLGVDVAWKHDTFAIVPIWMGPSYRALLDPAILTPPRDGSNMDVNEVKIAFELMFDQYQVDTVVMDMTRAEDIADWLEKEQKVKVIDWSQGSAQAARDYEAFMETLRNGKLKHTGSSLLRAHVMHAIARALPGDKRRFDRPAQSRQSKKQDERVIDALVAAAMVNCYVQDKQLFNLAAYRVSTV